MRAIAYGIVAAAASVSLASYAPARKRAPPAEVRAMTGAWQIGRLDEWPDTCALRLSSEQTIGGNAVVLGKGCHDAFALREEEHSWSAGIYAWRPGARGTIVLADAMRHGVITFTYTRMGTGDRAWIGHGPDGQDYELMRDRHPGKGK
jgi:hypothetical protein